MKIKSYFSHHFFNMNLQQTIRRILREEFDKTITCKGCGWSWEFSKGGEEPYLCHKCGNDNSKKELTEKCWTGYTQSFLSLLIPFLIINPINLRLNKFTILFIY